MKTARLLQLYSLAVTAALIASALPSSAHVAGAAPVGSSASVVLGPATAGNGSNQLHVLVADLRLPIQPGDTLTWNWSVNDGLGPDVEFTLHTHTGNSTLNYVEFRGPAENGSWSVVTNISLMISFVNPTAYNVPLNYTFTLYAPPVTFSPLFFILPAGAGLAVGWFLWMRAGRPADEGGLDEAYPTDPGAGKRRRGGSDEEE